MPNGHSGPLLAHTQMSPMTRIRIERILPAPGEILVRSGEQVGAEQKIARIPARGEIHVVNVARILNLHDPDLSRVMLKKRGDRVEAGETIAARRGVLPFLHKPCRSPVSGRLAAIGHGWVVIEVTSPLSSRGNGRGPEAETLDLLAFVAGRVAAITNHRSVTIESVGVHIVGACGVGGEGNGVLQVPVKDPTQVLTADDVGLGFNNSVLIGGAGVSPEALDRAREMKVRGIILGGISASLHYLIPPPSFPIVATEGYGNLPMSPMAFDILKRLEGHEVSISGRMGEVWDFARPSIIVPLTGHLEDEGELAAGDAPLEPARVGDRVRAVRQPLLGQVGEIVALPAEPEPVASGLSLSGAQVAFASGQYPAGTAHPASTPHSASTAHFVPWLNLERIG
jgi:hypothetical protein